MTTEAIFSYTFHGLTGPLIIQSDSHALLSISHPHPGRKKLNGPHTPRPILDCVRQLEEYFSKKRKTFDLNLQFKGTPFQNKVWRALQRIPYGEFVSYSQLASAINSPLACRAVGGANNANPFTIVIPCHRVVGIKNDLVGYGGGLDKKVLLLEHEGINVQNFQILGQEASRLPANTP